MKLYRKTKSNMASYKQLNEELTSRTSNIKPSKNKTVRSLKIRKFENGVCGFNLTRSRWDPYPWVNSVFVGTPAYVCGLKVGDCVLEVNGSDVLGLCLADIAKLVHAKSDSVTLLLWNAGCQDECRDESIFCGPLPRNLTRLTAALQSILKLIECPICLETIRPPTLQCQNGHLVCVNCRIRSINCPICRDHFTPRRSQIAEQLHATITSVFNLCQKEDRLRQKLFGCKSNKLQQILQDQESELEYPINNITSVVNKVTHKNGKISTHKYIKKSNSLESVYKKSMATTITTTSKISECENQIDNIVKIQSDKNHLTNTHYTIASMETLQNNNNNNKLTTKKYSVSTNDLSQQIALGQHPSLLALEASCNETMPYSAVGAVGNGASDALLNVLITPDVPLITIHGGQKCAQVDVVATTLEAKSASSSTLSLTTDNSSQCSCSSSIHYADTITTKSMCCKFKYKRNAKTNSMTSNCLSTSSESSGIYTSSEDYQSTAIDANNNNNNNGLLSSQNMHAQKQQTL